MINKQKSRARRSKKTRAKIEQLRMPRISIRRSSQHIYAQFIDVKGNVLAQASTIDPDLRSEISFGGNVDSARKVGLLLADRIKKAGVTKVAFDRSGYRFHGRVKALADGAREGGIEF